MYTCALNARGAAPATHTYIHTYVHADVGPRPHIYTYMHIHFMPGWCPGHTHTYIYIYIYIMCVHAGCALAHGHIHTNIRVCIYINGAITAHLLIVEMEADQRTPGAPQSRREARARAHMVSKQIRIVLATNFLNVTRQDADSIHRSVDRDFLEGPWANTASHC